jgi:hypothetical protein
LTFVDSRGAAEIGSGAIAVEILASRVVSEMICRVAKSVRIVVVTRFASLLVSSNDPILWLFNDHDRIKQVTGRSYANASMIRSDR